MSDFDTKDNSMPILARPRTTKQPDIKHQIEDMQKTRVALQEAVERLRKRFEAVLGAPQPLLNEKSPTSGTVTELSKILREITVSINHEIANINDIINCCEL